MKNIIYILFLLISNGIFGQELHIRAKELPCANKTFQIAVHIALDSLHKTNFDLKQLEDAFVAANSFFKPICFSFSICSIDSISMFNYNYDSLYSPLILNEIIAKHHDEKRINLYLLQFITQPEICGLTNLAKVNDPQAAYIFLDKNCPYAISHELGHLFGLLHTFEGNRKELVDGSNCLTEGDKICDTPADPYRPFEALSKYINKCEFINQEFDPSGRYYQPLVGNVMSYYGCDCGFTREQYLKMYDTYNSSIFKNW